MQAIQEAEDIDTGVDTRTKKEMVDDQMAAFSATAKTAAEVAPVIGDAIAVYDLPSDMRQAYELVQQGFSEGDIKDIGLGAGLAGLSALGVVPVLGTGAKIAKKGLRATIDDALVQTGDLFRAASGMDDTGGLVTVTDTSVKISKPPASADKGPTTFKFFGGDKGISSDQKYQDYAASKKKASEKSFDSKTDEEEFIFRDSKGTYVDPADKKFRYEIGTANLNFSDVIYERTGDSVREGPIVQLSFAQLQNKKRKAAIDAGFDAEDGIVLLPDLFENHEIFDEYPFLRNVQVKRAETDDAGQALYDGAFDPGAGLFSRQAILIDTVNNADNFKSILVHEMQHAIDFFEDRQFGADFNRLLKVEMETRGLVDTVDDNTMDGLNKAIRAFNELEKAEKREIHSIVSKKYSMVAGEVDARNVEFRLRNPNLQFQELPTKFTDEKAPEGKDVEVTKMYEGLDPIQSTSVKTQQAFAQPLEIGVSEFNVKNLDNPNIIKNYTVDDYNEAMRASNAGSTAGSKAQNKKINAAVEEGTDISVRLNLNSKIDPNGPDAPFNRMQTIHPVNPNTKKPNYNKADSYMNAVTVENGVFDVNQTSRRNIAETGKKVPAASVQGKFTSTRNVLEEGGDDIIEIGMNPQRQHLFTDLSNGQAVRSFDVATIIRDRVYAKGVKYWKKADAPTPLPAKGDTEIDNQVRYKFKQGGAIPMDRQMDMFDDGGLMDQGGSTDPVSGNEVPVGSLQEEVRDDIPAMLSEGEFVMPADVVRYHGLDKMMALRDEAKLGLARMEAMGQMGNAEEAIIPSDIPFGLEDLDIADDPLEMQVGGFVPQQQPYGTMTQPGGQNVFSVPSQFAPVIGRPVPFQQQFAPATPVTPVFGPGQPTGQPKETFTFDQLMPTSGGVSETREYRNAEGKSLYIPFINGEPVYPIPEGYTEYKPDATPDPTPDPVTTTTAAAPKEEDPSDGRELGGGPAGLTMNQSRISILSQLDDEFANKISGINKKYEAPSGLGAFSIMGGIGREFKKGSETRAALKDYDYDKLAESRGLTREELDSTLQELTSEIYSGYRDPVTGEVKGQKDPRSLFQRASDFVGGVEPSGDGDDLGTAPTTARVETTLEATQQAGVTASGAAKENVKALNDIMNELKIPENQKMDYLVKAAAGQGAQTFVTGPDRANTIRVDFSTFTPEVSAAAQDVLNVIGTRGDDRLKSMLDSSREVAQAEVRPTAAASIYKEPDPAGDILPGEPGSDTAFDPIRQEEEDRQTQNYISKGYDEPRAKAAAKNKVAADNIAKQQARDRGESEEHVAQTTAVTDSSGKPVTTTSAVTGKTTVVTSEPEKDDSDSGSGKIVCTEMYRQTQLDDWKQAIKIWGVYEKKYLTPYHEKGYHWLFKPWVRGMQTSSILTSVGAYLAQARTQHLKHVMTKGKAPDSFVGNVWCKIIHPIVYIAGRTKEWLKL
jgi:hypothetical protein